MTACYCILIILYFVTATSIDFRSIVQMMIIPPAGSQGAATHGGLPLPPQAPGAPQQNQGGPTGLPPGPPGGPGLNGQEQQPANQQDPNPFAAASASATGGGFVGGGTSTTGAAAGGGSKKGPQTGAPGGSGDNAGGTAASGSGGGRGSTGSGPGRGKRGGVPDGKFKCDLCPYATNKDWHLRQHEVSDKEIMSMIGAIGENYENIFVKNRVQYNVSRINVDTSSKGHKQDKITF